MKETALAINLDFPSLLPQGPLSLFFKENAIFRELLLQCLVQDALLWQRSADVFFFTRKDDPLIKKQLLSPFEIHTLAPTSSPASWLRQSDHELLNRGYKKRLLYVYPNPALPQHSMLNNIESLHHCQALIGPSSDDDYYLMGNSVDPLPWPDVSWQSGTALREVTSFLHQKLDKVCLANASKIIRDRHDLWRLEHDLQFQPAARQKLRLWLLEHQSLSLIIPSIAVHRASNEYLSHLLNLQPQPEIILTIYGNQALPPENLPPQVRLLNNLGKNRAWALNQAIQNSQEATLLFWNPTQALNQHLYQSIFHVFRKTDCLGGIFPQKQHFWFSSYNSGDFAFFIKAFAIPNIGPFKNLDWMEDVEWLMRFQKTGLCYQMKESLQPSRSSSVNQLVSLGASLLHRSGLNEELWNPLFHFLQDHILGSKNK